MGSKLKDPQMVAFEMVSDVYLNIFNQQTEYYAFAVLSVKFTVKEIRSALVNASGIIVNKTTSENFDFWTKVEKKLESF